MFPHVLEWVSDPVSLGTVCGSCGRILFWILLGVCSTLLGFFPGVLLLAYNYHQAVTKRDVLVSEVFSEKVVSLGIFNLRIGTRITDDFQSEAFKALLRAMPILFFWTIGSFIAEAYRYKTATRFLPSGDEEPHSVNVEILPKKKAIWSRYLTPVVDWIGFLIPMFLGFIPLPFVSMVSVSCAYVTMSASTFLTALFFGRVACYNFLLNGLFLVLATVPLSTKMMGVADVKVKVLWRNLKRSLNVENLRQATRVLSRYTPYQWLFGAVASIVVIFGLWTLYDMKQPEVLDVHIVEQDGISGYAANSPKSRRSKRSAPQEHPDNTATTPVALTSKRRLARGAAITQSPTVTNAPNNNGEGLELLQTPIVNPKASFAERGAVRRSARIRGLKSDEK